MQTPPSGDWLGHLGLPVQGAALVWAFYGGAKVVILIRGWIQEKRDGRSVAQADAADELTAAHLDLALTEHFDQLRRDLTTTIERAHSHTQKENVDAMQRFLLELELIVKGVNERRRPRA